MTQRKRQISSIFLMLCFIAPIGLTYAVLKLKQWQVREQIEHEIMLGIDKGELLQLTFSKTDAADLEWEHDREFMFEGQSYDVVEKEETTDSITYHVWWDKVETKIKNQLAELVSKALNQDEKQQQNQNQLQDFFKTLFHSQSAEHPFEFSIVSNQNFWTTVSVYSSLSWSPPVPPPIVG